MDHYTHQVQREAYAAALRDDAARDERTSENAKLRALVQKAVDAIDNWQNGPWIGKETAMHYARGGVSIGDFNRLAKEQGFVPTNTEDK